MKLSMAMALWIGRRPAAALLVGCALLGTARAETLTERTNRGLVELMTGADGSSTQMAQDLASLVDDGATRRLLPVLGRGALESLVDLKALRGIDMAIVQTDVLENAKQVAAVPNLESSITYIAKLHNEELHVLARPEVNSIADLAGKNVEFVGGAKVTGPAVLGALGIKTTDLFDDRAVSLNKLKAGEVAAMAYVAAKPTPLFEAFRESGGLHFLAVPMTSALAKSYIPSQLTAEDYPRFIVGTTPVDTVAVGTVLVVANLTTNTERYRNVANFVDAFFTQFPRLQEAPRHPKWGEVNLAAELRGLKRFPAADLWLKRNAVASAAPLDEKELHEVFTKFLDERSKLAGGRSLSAQEKDQLFDQFRRWQASQLR
jgi:TRAP-type uncharacterized transport system substrate-binding protein